MIVTSLQAKYAMRLLGSWLLGKRKYHKNMKVDFETLKLSEEALNLRKRKKIISMHILKILVKNLQGVPKKTTPCFKWS